MIWLRPSVAISQGLEPHPCIKREGLPPCQCFAHLNYRFLLKRMHDAFWESTGSEEFRKDGRDY